MCSIIVSFALFFSGVDAEAIQPETPVVERDAWQPAIREVLDQLDILELFSMATRLGGITVKVPREMQALPVRMIEGADELRDRGIEIYVTELQFRDVNFIYDETPEWAEERPRIPTLVEFRRLAFAADVKTRLGTAPVGATFENGKLPVDFLPLLEKGFDLAIIPESRQADTDLNNIRLQVGGPVASRIADRFFSDKVARLILEHGVGQTLQLGQGDLLAGSTALHLLDVAPDSRRGRAVESLIDALRR